MARSLQFVILNFEELIVSDRNNTRLYEWRSPAFSTQTNRIFFVLFDFSNELITITLLLLLQGW